MQAWGYTRVSTEDQADLGVSLKAQSEKIKTFCSLHNHDLHEIFEDRGLSGSKMGNRSGLKRALKAVCAEKGVLVVYSLSRLSRSTKDTLNIADRLNKDRADLASITEQIDTSSASGTMVFRLLAVLAEFERDQISERTKAALDQLRKENKRVSGYIPMGYDLDSDGKTLIPNPAEQKAIGLMKQYRENGVSYAKIGMRLESQGILSKQGKRWSPATIKRILDRQTTMS